MLADVGPRESHGEPPCLSRRLRRIRTVESVHGGGDYAVSA